MSILKQEAVKIIETIKRTLSRNDFPDFEDCLQDECAWEVMAEYLVTRNTNDFLSSKVSAISPDDFLQQFSF